MEAYPSRFDTAETEAFVPVYANFFKRLVAFVIDSILLYAVLMFLFTFFLREITFETADSPAANVLMWFMMALTALYSALMESSPMQGTLGKIVMGIQVTSLYGRRLSFLTALGRGMMKLLSVMMMFIGCIIAIFTKNHRALHDFAAKTVVIKKGTGRESQKAPIRPAVSGVSGAVGGRVQSPGHARNLEMMAGRAQIARAPQAPQTGGEILSEWDTGGAVINAGFDNAPAIISSQFHKALWEAMAKAGLPMYNAGQGDQLLVNGHFVAIDRGNRGLRYLAPGLTGMACVEVEGALLINGAPAANLYAKETGRGMRFTVFGGDSETLLLKCAADCGAQIARQVIAALQSPQWRDRA